MPAQIKPWWGDPPPPSKNRWRPLRRRGRPQAFIAALVVVEAARLYALHRRWSDVLFNLQVSGNGTYARNTLARRVRVYSAGQKAAERKRKRAK